MQSQPPWSDDWFRRYWVERAPPLTWRGISVWAVALAAGLAMLLAKPTADLWGIVGTALIAYGSIQILRGVGRKAWLALGGTDQPVRSYFRRRTDEHR
jgi:hypothetical protein